MSGPSRTSRPRNCERVDLERLDEIVGDFRLLHHTFGMSVRPEIASSLRSSQ